MFRRICRHSGKQGWECEVPVVPSSIHQVHSKTITGLLKRVPWWKERTLCCCKQPAGYFWIESRATKRKTLCHIHPHTLLLKRIGWLLAKEGELMCELHLGGNTTHSAHVQFAICWQYIVGRSLFDTTSHEDVGPTSLAHTPTLWPNGLPWKVSVLGTIHMMGLAKRVKARILQASTSEIYGDPEAGLVIFFSGSFQLYNSVMRRQRDIASESDGFRMAAAQNIFQRHRT